MIALVLMPCPANAPCFVLGTFRPVAPPPGSVPEPSIEDHPFMRPRGAEVPA